MHAQLAALAALMKLLDPQLVAFLAAAGADNYFPCYRWLLIHFKREFAFDEARSRTFTASRTGTPHPSRIGDALQRLHNVRS